MGEFRFIRFEDDPDSWRPNWRQPDEYSFCEELPPNRLAWEFLRRNPDYLNFWKAQEDEAIEFIHRYPDWFAKLIRYKELDRLPKFVPAFDPTGWKIGPEDLDASSEWIELQSELEYMADCTPDWPKYEPEVEEVEEGVFVISKGMDCDYSMNTWGALPVRPGEPENCVLSERGPEELQAGTIHKAGSWLEWVSCVQKEKPYLAWGAIRPQDSPKYRSTVLGVFDLDDDLSWQFKRVKNELRESQKNYCGVMGLQIPKLGMRVGVLEVYLRVLDAAASGADRVSVARAVWPNVYGEVKDKPTKPKEHNRDLVAREKREKGERDGAVRKVKETLRQAQGMLGPEGYLRLVKLDDARFGSASDSGD